MTQDGKGRSMTLPQIAYTAEDDHLQHLLIKKEETAEHYPELVLIKEEKEPEDDNCEIPIKEEPLLWVESELVDHDKVRYHA